MTEVSSHLSQQTLKALEWPVIQNLLESMARTEVGRQLLRSWHPSVDRPQDRAQAIMAALRMGLIQPPEVEH